jgi:hypothetical protein
MTDFKLTTPVALIIFNRPDTTERVFAEIARAKPLKLLVIGDGPRPSRQGEAQKVEANYSTGRLGLRGDYEFLRCQSWVQEAGIQRNRLDF